MEHLARQDSAPQNGPTTPKARHHAPDMDAPTVVFVPLGGEPKKAPPVTPAPAATPAPAKPQNLAPAPAKPATPAKAPAKQAKPPRVAADVQAARRPVAIQRGSQGSAATGKPQTAPPAHRPAPTAYHPAETAYRPATPPPQHTTPKRVYSYERVNNPRSETRRGTATHSTATRGQPARLTLFLQVGAAALLVVALVLLAVFYNIWAGYQASRASYQKLNSNLHWAQSTPAAKEGSQLDFSALLAQNPDTVGWITAPGMGVSLPVTQSAEGNIYLDHGFDGTPNSSGCLFLASWDTAGWAEGLHRVIYGHNIHDGTMFGQLANYRDKAFYAQNPAFMLYTPQGDYQCVVFACADATDGDENYTLDWQQGPAYDAYLAGLKANALYDTGVEVPGGSQILTLSTCTSSFAVNDQRFVVHAVMEKVG
ncbi:MAG: sortase [Gemmiger sp.]|nr:sortase [Gemmiger sp.]